MTDKNTAADMATAAAQGFRDGVASLSANAGEPRKVFLVATGEEHEGEATYTRYDDKPPPLCDSECLFASPPTAQAGEPVAWRYWNEKSKSWNTTTSAAVVEVMAEFGRATEPLYLHPAPQPAVAEGVEHG